MGIDLSSLRMALASLERALARSERSPEDEELRDAVIQRFEYTFEMCWRMLRRRLQMDAPDAGAIARMSYRELIREGHIRGYIVDFQKWMGFRNMRNLTSHTYNQKTAQQIRAAVPDFALSARDLLNRLSSDETTA